MSLNLTPETAALISLPRGSVAPTQWKRRVWDRLFTFDPSSPSKSACRHVLEMDAVPSRLMGQCNINAAVNDIRMAVAKDASYTPVVADGSVICRACRVDLFSESPISPSRTGCTVAPAVRELRSHLSIETIRHHIPCRHWYRANQASPTAASHCIRHPSGRDGSDCKRK